MVPRADLVFDVYIESMAKPFDSSGWDMEFTVFDDYVSLVFGGCVNVGELSMLKSVSSVSWLFVNVTQSALLWLV